MNKVFFSLVWCFLLFSLVNPILYSQNYGDVNEDGSVDIIDALYVAMYYVGIYPPPAVGINPPVFNEINADVNCDSNIDIVDALLIAKYYVDLIKFFPCEQIIGIELGIPFKLKYGQTARFNGENMLTFQDVLSDSRCPIDVLCVWEGEVEVQLEYSNPEVNATRFSLSSVTNMDEQVGNYLFAMDNEVLPPQGTSDSTIDKEDYVITIIITRSEPIPHDVWISHVSGYQCQPEIFPTVESAQISSADLELAIELGWIEDVLPD